MSNGYPFMSRRAVAEKITSEPSFALECVRLVDERQGWMASHKVRAGKVLARIAAGELSPSDLAEAISLISPHARTVSHILREREMAERPELAAQAVVFGVVLPTTVQPDATTMPVATTSTEPVSVPRKRGRPKGSKNKPKEESTPKRRRRP